MSAELTPLQSRALRALCDLTHGETGFRRLATRRGIGAAMDRCPPSISVMDALCRHGLAECVWRGSGTDPACWTSTAEGYAWVALRSADAAPEATP